MLGLGIDTGGTYTDAVIYDFNKSRILYYAKSVTTKEDLSIGIANVLDELPKKILKQVDIVSLSTTLATNACVEGKGGRGKLIFIGADKEIIKEKGIAYGLPDYKEIFFLDGQIDYKGNIVKEPNWESFLEDSKKWLENADAVAIVQQLGVRNTKTEEKAKEVIESEYSLQVICGHELYSDLNYIKRGASALLNAQLIPVIENFLKAIEKNLRERDMKIPIVILRSDGSLMSQRFAQVRPVETLLCGPAASVMGGVNLAKQDNCIVLDMGGTTTDLALVKNGVPVIAEDGANVGRWKTFVKSIYIDTFGLGGDSRVSISRNGEINLGSNKVMPLSVAAKMWPQIIKKLRDLNYYNIIKFEPLHEFFYLLKDVTSLKSLDKEELALCKELKHGPISYLEAKKLLKTKVPIYKLEKLEKEGIIMRCGITPTDIMHIKGDFTDFNKEAAFLGVSYLLKQYLHFRREKELSIENFCDKVYDLVKEKLYVNIVRFLLEDKYSHLKNNGLNEDFKRFIKDSWDISKNKDNPLKIGLYVSTGTIVGVGAPIHIFLPDVAKALGCNYIIPEFAGVANALGTIVGNVRVESKVEVKPHDEGGFIIYGRRHSYAKTLEEAIEIAQEEAKDKAKQEAIMRGAIGDITVYTEKDENISLSGQLRGAFISTTVKAIAVGSITF